MLQTNLIIPIGNVTKDEKSEYAIVVTKKLRFFSMADNYRCTSYHNH